MTISRKALYICGTALAGIAMPTVIHAQESQSEITDAGASAGDSAIVVTGSRIIRNGFDSPVLVQVVDSGLIENLAQTSAQDVVRLLPQNIATQSDATSGTSSSANVGSSFANLRGLNPTFGTRTLTLVNGRRFVPSSDGGQVDLNLIPSVMISRVETVTGGASAAYGSDAVAGVVNVILDNKREGFKGQIDYGQTGRGDGKSFHGAGAYGLKFGGGRGHFMIGGEYQKNYGIEQCAYVRQWCAESWIVLTNEATLVPGVPNTTSSFSGYNVPGSYGYGQPNFIIAPNGGFQYNSANGVIRNLVSGAGTSRTSFNGNFPAFNPPLAAVDKAFTADGKGVTSFNPGLFGPRALGGTATGSDSPSIYINPRIQTPIERYTLYGTAEFEFSDSLKLVAEATYGDRGVVSQTLTSTNRSTMPLKADNPYLPPAVAASLNGQAFSFSKNPEEMINLITVDAQIFRGVVGLSGKMFSDWTWDVYYQYGDNKRNSAMTYSRNNDAFMMAIDAVRDPANPNNIICRPLSPTLLATFAADYRAKLQELYSRCAPLNMIGQGNMSQAAINFAWQKVGEAFAYHQHVLAGSLQGTLHQGWGAGPIGVAAGVDYRQEAGDVTHGNINPNDYAFSFGLDYAGKIRVVEGFFETNVPVLRDSALGRSLELNGAIRYTKNKSTDTLTNQSRSLGATSWKLGMIYDVVDGLRFRGTQSRDIRAAGFRELFQKTAPTDVGTAQGRVNNPNITSANKADDTPIFSGGNFTLAPEIGDTTTIGAVFKPAFLPGFQVSLDWYRIQLTDAIANLNGQRVTDLCVSFSVLCNRVTFASPTDITRVDAGAANVGKIDIRGFDFEASYRLPLDTVASTMKGALNFRFLLNHQYDFVVTQNPAIPAINYAGQSGPRVEGGDFNPTPKWMWNALIAYDTDRFNATMTIRHIGKGMLNGEWIGPEDPGYAPTLRNSVSTNRVAAATYFNIAMSYQVPFGNDDSQNVELFGAIENLFDKKPPVAPGGGVTVAGSAYPTNPVFFDTFGMRWRAGMRVKF